MKRLFTVLLAITLCISAVGCSEADDPTIDVAGSSLASSSDTSSDASSGEASSDAQSSSENTSSEEEYVIDLSSWEMLLVNPWNAIPEGFDPELAVIDGKYAGFDNAQFDARAIDQLHAMCAAAAEDGIKLVIISAYRTNDFQTFNFNRKVSRVMAADPTLTREQAEEQAATVVARPGTSEHQVGLAVDFNSVESSFKNTKEYKWLEANCTDYGFILRYTAEKQDKTGIIPEPWHYRYVGVENAKAIKESGLCMEEFIEKHKNDQE